MGAPPELIAALREDAEKQVAALWDTARSRAEQSRVQAEQSLALARTEADEDTRDYAQRLQERVTAEAKAEAEQIRMAARESLADRAWRLACGDLQALRAERYDAVFAALAREIPPGLRRYVRVNPADRELAHRHFADAEVQPDEEIAGGMATETRDRRVRVDNTLRKRLARAWPDILPELISDILKETSDRHAPA